ncbi:hypothetical protein NWF24_17870 [Variovorax paradoxus]|uniref:hypothetical protein n=1 Tax=Variovorax paradoxus TaxID=34073 RepID=UPI0021AC28AF|nr:hypothetical protein [Variovorax paradoxus]UVH54715.1 hypothetical protein NWF24_17870 [Variovorax paradoxus]
MPREVKSAEEIQAEVSRLVHEGELVREDGAVIGVHLPRAYADGVREPNGSNWYMDVFSNSAGYEGWVKHVYYKVQSQWDLES